MSAQTGTQSVAPPAPESRRIDQARSALKRLRNDPNPVWMRELRQSARLTRTPLILALVTALMTLLLASIGGIMSGNAEPATVGYGLHQTFFSLAFFVVALVAPAVAASTIASERGGRTWEALLLTGLSSPTIARGKLLASLSYIGLYLVMLAPVGALPFLFGGVTAVEVLTAFLGLALIAVIGTCFGLAISSRFGSPVVAILLALFLSLVLAIVGFLLFGVFGAFAAHEIWDEVPGWHPIWLPTALGRAPLGLDYVVLLIGLPVAAALLPSWFLFETTVANMASVSDDQSSGLRRWFLATVPVLTAGAIAPALLVNDKSSVAPAAVVAQIVLFVVLLLCAFVFAGEPLGPSRRVLIHWDRKSVGALRRFIGPGVVQAFATYLAECTIAMGGVTAVGVALVVYWGYDVEENVGRVLAVGVYALAYLTLLAGVATFLRARSRSGVTPRVLMLVVIFLTAVGPWILVAIGGLAGDLDAASLLAAPSPLYVFVVLQKIDRADGELHTLAGAGASAFWWLLGVAMFAAGAGRTRKLVTAHQTRLAEAEAALAAEDAEWDDAGDELADASDDEVSGPSPEDELR